MESAEILLKNNLIVLRQVCGFSLMKMAKLTGISYKTLKSIENGGYAGNITVKQLKVIHKNFGIPSYIMVDKHPERIEELYILHIHGNEARMKHLFEKSASN